MCKAMPSHYKVTDTIVQFNPAETYQMTGIKTAKKQRKFLNLYWKFLVHSKLAKFQLLGKS